MRGESSYHVGGTWPDPGAGCETAREGFNSLLETDWVDDEREGRRMGYECVPSDQARRVQCREQRDEGWDWG